MDVLSVVGARPQFVKLGPIAEAFSANGTIRHTIVHTGQHYDPGMSAIFFRELNIPDPDINLGIGSASHGVQTGAMLARLDGVLEERRPDWVLVYGDTNSTLAAVLSAVKMHVPVAHLEAGLRSFNRRMPEEHNRVLTDHAADLLLAPTDVAMGHLSDEGLAARAVNVGDVMTDLCFRTRDQVRGDIFEAPAGMRQGEPFVIATIHRAENTDDPERLQAIVSALMRLDAPVMLLTHPRLEARAATFGIRLRGGSLHGSAPLSHGDMVRALMSSVGVVTDSGGLQKEAFLLQVPCVTIRTETEWIETLEDGWNILDPDLTLIGDVAVRPKPTRPQGLPFGDGAAAARVVDALNTHWTKLK